MLHTSSKLGEGPARLRVHFSQMGSVPKVGIWKRIGIIGNQADRLQKSKLCLAVVIDVVSVDGL